MFFAGKGDLLSIDFVVLDLALPWIKKPRELTAKKLPLATTIRPSQRSQRPYRGSGHGGWQNPSSTFSEFGPHHKITDATGEPTPTPTQTLAVSNVEDLDKKPELLQILQVW
jgi:hypothetical protein